MQETLPPGPSPRFDWDVPAAVGVFMLLVSAQQNTSAHDLDALDRLSLAIYEDLLEQRGRVEGETLDMIDFLHWAARALVDDYRAEAEGDVMHVDRIVGFPRLRNPTLRAQVEHTALERATCYVAWATGDHIHLARAAEPAVSSHAVGSWPAVLPMVISRTTRSGPRSRSPAGSIATTRSAPLRL